MMQSGEAPATGSESFPATATWAQRIDADCAQVAESLKSRRSRFFEAVSLHGNRRNSSLVRLSASIVRAANESTVAKLAPNDMAQVQALLCEATTRLKGRDANGGWDALNAASRVTIATISDDVKARKNLSIVMRAEVTNKLDDWRKVAALELLDGGGQDTPPEIDALRRAQAQLDEHSANVFRRLDIYGSVLTFVLAGLTITLAGFCFAVYKQWLPELRGTRLGTVRSTTGIMLLGALGSFLSVALTRVTNRKQKLPEMIQGRLVDLLRPVIGAASGVAMVLIIDSGLESAVQSEGSKIYVWALVAGFSERLLRRTLNSLADSVKDAPSPTTKTDAKNANG
jgi:hypothetical protein